jgi:hypothetical protein
MMAPDRTDELIRAMLERRAGGAVPAWLPGAVIGRVVTKGRPRRGMRGLASRPQGAGRRRALVAALVLPLGVLAGAALAVGFLKVTGADAPAQQAVVAVPSDQPSLVAPSADPAETSSPSPASTPRVLPATLGQDTMAVVTEAGTRLRVRTAPGVGSDSVMLNPLLPAGTRMLVMSGPVAVDGYDWYEVMTRGNPWPRYGWVASGKNGEAWIEPALPDCRDQPDARAVVSLHPLDYLLCYGNRAVDLHVTAIEAQPGTGGAWCPWTSERSHCEIDPAWMNQRVLLAIDAGNGVSGGVIAVVPPDLVSVVNATIGTEGATITVAADSPDARACRIVDSDGSEVVPRARAVLECRATFVITALGPASTGP